MMRPYPARIYRDGLWWTAEFRDHPGCATCGKTPAEARAMAGDALAQLLACSIGRHKATRPSRPRSNETMIWPKRYRAPWRPITQDRE